MTSYSSGYPGSAGIGLRLKAELLTSLNTTMTMDVKGQIRVGEREYKVQWFFSSTNVLLI